MRTLVWYRGKDLRIADHQPLADGIAGGEVITLFVVDPYFFSAHSAAFAPHRMQYLLESLAALKSNLKARGGELLLGVGHSVELIPQLAALWKVDRVVAHRWTEPVGQRRDTRIAARLGVPFILYDGETLLPPDAVLNKQGAPFSVYTPFARAARDLLGSIASAGAPKSVPAPPVALTRSGLISDVPTLHELGLRHNPHLVQGGEAAARGRMQRFLAQLEAYAQQRDELGAEGSGLSADLKFGTLSVRTVLEHVLRLPGGPSQQKFIAQLLWREFAYHCLWHRPWLLERPFRAEFAEFPWSRDQNAWATWAEGRTGYPIVDASARQLLREGFVHNRARMISASFLTKHLLVHYELGERHYLKFLTDGDWAINNMGWQWSAGCGVDAQPYFRVFNPVLQGQRFDKNGAYVRRYVPELARLPDRYLHCPWAAPPDVLRRAAVVLGETYPPPVVEHNVARQRFLALTKSSLKPSGRG